jgi:tetratricopeptide (TPR) repeat protein
MKKTLASLNLILAGALAAGSAVAQQHPAFSSILMARAAAAPQEAAAAPKQRQWKSTDEYNAFSAMAKETDPNKKISLAEAFLAKYANSDFAYLAHQAMMGAYQQLRDSSKAMNEADEVLKVDPDNLDALRYLSFDFPFTYKPDDPNAAQDLSKAQQTAQHGLDLLAKLQKPANASQAQFDQAVKGLRSIFNGTLGFVALQQKDYSTAISRFKSALEDNPQDLYTCYRLGVSYIMSSPPDYNNAFWYLGRAVSLAKSSNSKDEASIEKYLTQAYVNYHGNNDGLPALIAQAGSAPTPGPDFKVAPLEKPKPTGNPNLDSFNQVTWQLKLGGSRAEQAWDQLKGKPLGLGGFVHAVSKGADPGSYAVQISLDKSNAPDSYDIELRDSSQPKVADLVEGDPIRFQGTIASYTTTPTFVLTLEQGKINDDDLAAAAATPKAKPKAPPRRRRHAR